jgi:hyperosmotically inducible periplasmic protein
MTTNRTKTGALALGALIALGMAGCASWHDSINKRAEDRTVSTRDPMQTASDATLTAKVKAVLAADELVKARNINVDTMRGVVTLHGSVRSAAERDKALSLTRGTGGVLEVKDRLTIIGG